MKKLYMLGALTALLGLSACQKDGYQEVTRTLSGPAITIISSNNDGNVYVSSGYYTYNLKMTNDAMTGTVESPEELIADNLSLSFTTLTQNYKSTGYDAYFENSQGTAGSTTMQLNNANFLALYLYDKENNKYGYFYNTTPIGDYTYKLASFSPWITIATYEIGNSYKVNTFQTETFFQGKTTTSYQSANGQENFTTEGITYRFIVDIKEKKASMIIYDAKFSGSPYEPTKAAILAKNLDIEFTPTYISISGENIIPDVYESNGYTPYEDFIFNHINFKTTSNDYTEGVIDYQVAGRYNGHFEGSYVSSYYHP